MGRGRDKRKPIIHETLDATPERLQHAANEWEFIDPSRIDSVQPIGLVRRFRATHLDRWYKRDKPEKSIISYRQHHAGNWYRETHARAGYTMSVVASYGERVSGGEPAYGLARTERQALAREQWREARAAIPRAIVGFIDRLLLHDELPRYGGKQWNAKIKDIRSALDAIGDYIKLAKDRDAQCS